MANDYIQKQATSVIESGKFDFPLGHAMATANIIANMKGINIKIFDVRDASSLSDYYIIASTQNPIQSRSMVDEISYNLKQNGMKNISTEGLEDADWVLIDMGDIIIHLFQEISRDIFDLDVLWSNYPQVEIPQEYYYSDVANPATTEEDTKSYF
jgi:ribosome-associated protein